MRVVEVKPEIVLEVLAEGVKAMHYVVGMMRTGPSTNPYIVPWAMFAELDCAEDYYNSRRSNGDDCRLYRILDEVDIGPKAW